MTERQRWVGLWLIVLPLLTSAFPANACAAEPAFPGESPAVFKADLQAAWVVALSPDGKTLVTGGTSAVLRFWDVPSLKPRAEIPTDGNALRAAAFSPDGTVLATGHQKGVVMLWDPVNAERRTILKHGSKWFRTLAFSPDGKRLVTGGQQQPLDFWDVATGKVLRTLPGLAEEIFKVAYSPDGKTLAVAIGDSKSGSGGVRLFDAKTMKQRLALPGIETIVWSLAYSPDGSALATSDISRKVHLWDPLTGQEQRSFAVPLHFRAVAFTPDGKSLAMAGALGDSKIEGSAILWDLAEGRPRSVMSGHTGLIMAMSLSPDGRLLATASTDTTARLWDMSRLPAAPVSATADPNARPGGSAMLVERRPRAGSDPADAVMLALAYSPDGKLLAMGGEDRTITVRDAATGAVLKTLAGHTDIVAGLAFSPDGNSLASASYDKSVRIWDLGEGRQKTVLEGHKNWVLAVAYAPDGKTLATASYDKLVKLWDLSEAKELASFTGHSASVRAVAFTLDGKTVASGGSDRVIKLWDVAGRSERAMLKGHKKTIRALASSPDGTLIASASEDGTLKLWDLAHGIERATLEGHADMVTCVAFASGGRRLLSGCWDGTIKLWDTGTGKEQASTRAHAEAIAALACAPDGRQLVTSGHDKVWKLWESTAPIAQVAPSRTLADLGDQVWMVAFAPDGKTMIWGGKSRTLFVHHPPGAPARAVDLGLEGMSTIVFAPNGRTFAIGHWETVTIYETATLRRVSTLKGHSHIVRTLAFSPDGEVLATGSLDHSVKLWNVAVGDEIPGPPPRSLPVSNVAFTPDGATLVVTTGEWSKPREVGEVTLWDVATAAPRGEFTGHTWGINALLVTADGKTVVTGSGDGVRILDISTRTCRATLRSSVEPSVRSLALSPDGRTLASGSFKGDLVLWDFAAGRETAVLRGHQGLIDKLAFAPDGRSLASCSYDKTLKLWSLVPEQRLPPRTTVAADQIQIRSVSYSPDGTKLLVAGGAFVGASAPTAIATVRDAGSGKPLITLRGHQKGISSAAFSPDGKTVATASWDATIRLCNADTGAAGLSLAAGSASYLAFAPAGTSLISAGQDRALKHWDVASGALGAQAEGDPARLQCVAFSRDGTLLATGGGPFDDTAETSSDVRLWTVGDTFTEVARLAGHSRSVLAAAFTPDGKSLVTGGVDRSLRVWDVASRQVRVAIEGLPGWVEGLAVSPDGRWIASAGKGSNDVLLHDLNTGEERFRLAGHSAVVRGVAFSPDGKTLATGGDDGTLRFWDVPAPASTTSKR